MLQELLLYVRVPFTTKERLSIRNAETVNTIKSPPSLEITVILQAAAIVRTIRILTAVLTLPKEVGFVLTWLHMLFSRSKGRVSGIVLQVH